MSDATGYPLQLAVDVLDRLTTEHAADREELVRGAIALALRVSQHPAADIGEVLYDLEKLATGKTTLDSESVDRMLRVVAQLRTAVGVH